MSGAGTSEVEVRRLTSDGVQILFTFNHAKGPAEATISIRLPWPHAKGFNLETGQAVSIRDTKGEVVVQKRLAAGEIWVVKLTPA